MLNKIIVMGRLTHDPELRRTQSGTAVCSFSIACDRDYGKDEEKKTDFLDIVAWRERGEFVAKYFTKGRMIVVAGSLQIRDWTDKNGNKRRTAEIIASDVYFGDSRPKQEGEDSAPAYGSYEPSGSFAEESDGFGGFDVPEGFDPGFGG